MEYIKRNKDRLLILLIIIVVVLLNLFVIRFSMDFIFFTLVLVAFVFKKEKIFLKDWLLPIIGFYLYEYIRGMGYIIGSFLGREVLVNELVIWEKSVFFFLEDIPTVILQYWLSNPMSDIFIPHLYDYIMYLFYTSFFWFWLVIGFLIWVKDRVIFNKYIYGLVAFSIFDSLIYIIFPSAPPWYASGAGILPPLRRVMLSHDYLSTNYASLVSTYGNNDFAAFPSHHSAWPFYASLFFVRVYGKKYLFSFVIPLIIAFATWYGAEHYVIDSIAGWIIAIITFLISLNWEKIVKYVKRD